MVTFEWLIDWFLRHVNLSRVFLCSKIKISLHTVMRYQVFFLWDKHIYTFLWFQVFLSTGWNDKIVALDKTWFHFCLMKTGFPLFIADHLLVGQLCTNPKSDRSLLSCLKVTQCSTSEIGDAPLYNSCSLLIQVMTTGPLPAPSKCKSGWFNAWGHSSTH